MVKIKVVIDAGPIIHLAEIDEIKLLDMFHCIVPEEISKEAKLPKSIEIANLEGHYKDFSKLLSERFGLQLGEAQCIALALQEGIKIFLTDDMEARIAAKSMNLEPHGTIGIIAKAFRNDIISQKEAFLFLDMMKTKSSLFVTSDIIQYAKESIKKFKK